VQLFSRAFSWEERKEIKEKAEWGLSSTLMDVDKFGVP
jgi:hypothetical protein